ncbi:hypothetical protein D9M68_84390 [compost metagenome]
MAVPAWHGHLLRGWRAQARTALAEGMLRLERHAVGAMTFAAAPGGEVAAGEWPLPVPATGTVRHIVTARHARRPAWIPVLNCVPFRNGPTRSAAC